MFSKTVEEHDREPPAFGGLNMRGVALQMAALHVAAITGASPREVDVKLQNMPGFRWTDAPGDPAVYDSIEALVEEYGRT